MTGEITQDFVSNDLLFQWFSSLRFITILNTNPDKADNHERGTNKNMLSSPNLSSPKFNTKHHFISQQTSRNVTFAHRFSIIESVTIDNATTVNYVSPQLLYPVILCGK